MSSLARPLPAAGAPMAKPQSPPPHTNGASGFRALARSYSAEAIERAVQVMRNSSDDHAVAFACYAILMTALSRPEREREERM